eukprot:scaffold42950_cov36-Phaeocystis_antarctica.AAC.2
MTPLYDMSTLPDCQLLCKAPDGAVQQYRYALGAQPVQALTPSPKPEPLTSTPNLALTPPSPHPHPNP